MNSRKIGLLLCVFMVLRFTAAAQDLSEYYKEAAENNPGLQAKYHEFEAAVKKAAYVGVLPDPQMSFGMFIQPIETRVGPQQARVSLSQVFPWFGTLKAKEEAAALAAEAAYQEFLYARNELYFRVRKAFYPLIEWKQSLRIEKENLGILETYRAIAESKYENDLGTMVDVLRVELMIDEAETDIQILKRKKRPLLVAFTELLNREDTAGIRITDGFDLPGMSSLLARDSLMKHPKLKSAGLRKSAYEKEEEARRKEGLPKIGLGLDYVFVGKDPSIPLPDNGKDAVMPMATFSLPIYRKKVNNKIEEARLRALANELKQQEMENNLQTEYETVLFDLNSSLAQINLYQGQVKTVRRSIDLLLAAYSTSGKDFEEILRMQQQLLKYRLNLVNAKQKYMVDFARFELLTSKNL